MPNNSPADEIYQTIQPFLDSFETLGKRLFPEWLLSRKLESHASGFHSVTIGDMEVLITLTIQDVNASFNPEKIHIHEAQE